MNSEQIRGLYLVPPHGELIATGVKSAVVKSKYVPGHRLFDLRGDWMLVSKVDGVGLGLGDVTLGEPVEMSLEEFDTKETEHRVSRVDRMRWWPEYGTLWKYPIEGFKGYAEPLAIDVPAGVQTVMQDVGLDEKGWVTIRGKPVFVGPKGGKQGRSSVGSHLDTDIYRVDPSEVTKSKIDDWFDQEGNQQSGLLYRSEAQFRPGSSYYVLLHSSIGKEGYRWTVMSLEGEPYGHHDGGSASKTLESMKSIMTIPMNIELIGGVWPESTKRKKASILYRLLSGKVSTRELDVDAKKAVDAGVQTVMSSVVRQDVDLDSPATAGTGVKARHSRSRCMECKSSPVIDVHWADGRGRAWFCLKHFKEWIEDNDRGIVRAFYLSDGEAPVKIGEGEQVLKSGEQLSQEELVERVEALIATEGEKAYSSVAIALAIPPPVAKKLAVEGKAYEGGEGQGVIPVDQLHLTLAFLGDAKELEKRQELLQKGVAAFAAKNQVIPGEIKGRIVFDTPNGSAVCAHFDSPELSDFRQRFVVFLDNLGFELKSEHGFTPHICLAYVEPGQEAGIKTPAVPDVTLRELSVLWAENRTDYQLKGTETKETDMQEITVLLDDEQLTGEKVYSKLSEANPAIRGMDPKVSLEQANAIARWADAMEKAEDGPESPWGAAIARFKELYEVNEAGDGWVKRAKSDSKAKWTGAYIGSLPDTAFLLIESGGEKKDGITRPLSLRHLPYRNSAGDIDVPHLQNAISRAPQLEDKEGKSFPKATIEKLQEKARKLLAESKKARGEGQGVGKPRQGDTGAEFCICPECDHIVEHERGTPCNEVKCKECGEMMRGATEAEIETAGVQADRAVVAATATGMDIAAKGDEDTVVFYGKEPPEGWTSTEGAAVKAGRFRTLSDGRRVQITGRAFTASGGKSGWFGSGSTEGEPLTEKQGDFLDGLLKSDEENRDRTRSSNDSQNLNRYFGDSTWRQFKKDHLGRGALSPEDRVRFRENSSQAMKKFDRDVSTWLSVASSANLSKAGASRAISALKDGHSGAYLQLRFGNDAAAKVSYLGNLFGTKEMIPIERGEDQKEGRRVRQDKVGLLQKLKDELHEFLASLGEFVSWATYGDKPKDSAPEEFNLSTLLDIAGKKALEQGSTAFAFKALDGTTWWFQWTTNAFKDREGEIFTTQSISDFVDRKENDDIKGEFWFWHTPGSKFGTVRLQAIVGRFLAQAGPFDNTAVGRAFKEFFSVHPHSHPDIAPEGWGTSHGYSYKSVDREDGVYNWFDIRESTVLPRRFASNPFSPMPQILQEVKQMKQMNEQQRKAFMIVGGQGLVDSIVKVGEESTKKLEGEVDFKGATLEDEKAGGNYVARIKEIVKSIEDDGLKGQVEVFCAELEKAIPTAKKEDETGESEKATDMTALAGQLRMLAGKVGGDAGKNLAAIAEEMATVSGKKESEPEAEKVVEPEAAEPKVDILTREEVADAMKAMVEVLRDEIKETTDATVTEIAKALEPLVAEVKSLKEADEVKIAEKAAETPAASLSSLLQSVIGNKATLVDADSQLAKSGPKETAAPTDGFTGIPFVDAFIGESDQSAAGGN